MRDMTFDFQGVSLVYLIGENCVSEKKEDPQCFYSKVVNVKIAITLVNTMLRIGNSVIFVV